MQELLWIERCPRIERQGARSRAAGRYNFSRAPAREASFSPVLVYVLGPLSADREGGGPSV